MEGRRAKGKAREDRVVEAASRAIAELGLANVRVSDIAERAGMTTSHITYYFPSKTDLLMLAVGEDQQGLVDQVEQELRLIPDPWVRLTRYIDLTAAKEHGDPDWLLWFQLWSSAALDESVARAHGELDAKWRRILTDIIEYGVSRGEFVAQEPAVSARLISAMIDGLSIQLTVGSPSTSQKEVLELCLQSAGAFVGSARSTA